MAPIVPNSWGPADADAKTRHGDRLVLQVADQAATKRPTSAYDLAVADGAGAVIFSHDYACALGRKIIPLDGELRRSTFSSRIILPAAGSKGRNTSIGSIYA